MVIEYEGRTYEFDLEDMTVRQALAIEKFLGGPIETLEKGMAAGMLAAYQCVGWLVLHGGDPGMPIADVDFKLGRFSKAFEAAARAEAEAEAAKAAETGPTAAASNGRASVPASPLSA